MWVEYPVYTQFLFIFDRIKELAPQHPEWKTNQPFKAVLEGDMKVIAASGKKGILELGMATHSGMTADEFKKTVSNISHCYSMTPAKPVICGEVAYEGHTDRPPNIYKNHDELSPFPQRYLFWTSMLQGAAGHTYGANGIWQVESPEYPHGWSETCTNNNFWLTPWYTAKDFFGSISLPLGKKLLERYEWWRFEPHQDWVNPAGTSLTDAHSTWTNPLTIWNNLNGNCMLPYAAGIANEVRVIYIPFGATAPQVKKIETSVDYKAFYLNPADGTEYDLGAVAPISGNWQAPVLPTTSSDWILVLEKEN